MHDTAITYLQLFLIGLGLGLAGPCVLTCTSVMIAYVAGSDKRWGEALRDMAFFLLGRMSAYALFGALAGLSGSFLREFSGARNTRIFNIAAGVISILLGISILISNRHGLVCNRPRPRARFFSFAGLFGLGFTIGAAPCAPLAALFFEVALISKTAVQGAAYALSFGLGSAVSALVVAGGVGAGVVRLSAKFLRQEKGMSVIRIISAALLLAFGVYIIL